MAGRAGKSGFAAEAQRKVSPSMDGTRLSSVVVFKMIYNNENGMADKKIERFNLFGSYILIIGTGIFHEEV